MNPLGSVLLLLPSRCPNCGGVLVRVDLRAWCVATYLSGGCSSYWTAETGEWRRVK